MRYPLQRLDPVMVFGAIPRKHENVHCLALEKAVIHITTSLKVDFLSSSENAVVA